MFLKENKQRIEEEFGRFAERLPHIYEEVSKKLQQLNENVSLAMKYLYTTMPNSDIGNYPFEIFLDYANHGVRLYEESEEVRKLPEILFLNYVLHHRINEEEIKPCRSFFYEKLKDRVHGLWGTDAVQEVNYWCVEEVTYQSTDDRTLAPIDVYNRGNGRCGEESTFTVSALRSIGIPARQVYAPQWSHCDDNHAWVEVWCDGDWYFTGACEPVPILNKGWFTNASSRAMMIHSRWFDFIPSKEEEIGKEGMVTMLNELHRYARVKKIKICVSDENENPVSDAAVIFEVLNYAEFAPIAQCITNKEGCVELTTGFGSLHLHVKKSGVSTECFMDTSEVSSCNVILKNKKDEEVWQPYDMIAPVDTRVNTDMPTKEQHAEGEKRLHAATQIRLAKTENWSHPGRICFLASESEAALYNQAFRLKMLSALTEKDQTDVSHHVLEEHLKWALPFRQKFQEDVFINYVLNPRIENEVLTTYREFIIGFFTKEEKALFYTEPQRIWKWVTENICVTPERERHSIVSTPVACLKLRTASLLSQKILFVAIARTLGIPAQLNPQDGGIEYLQDQVFQPVAKEFEKNCSLTLVANDDFVWTYSQHWSIAKKVDGSYYSLKLTGEKWNNQRLSMRMEEGEYRILTTNRLPNGNQFLNVYTFCLKKGDNKEIVLVLRNADLADMLGNISMEEFQVYKENQFPVDASNITKGAKNIFLWLEESKEPTEHILNELIARKTDFKKYAKQIIFIIRTKSALEDPTISKALKVFPEIQIFYDDFKENVNVLGRRMYVDHEKLPLIIVTNGKLNGIYATSGYNVGTGDMLLRLMELK